MGAWISYAFGNLVDDLPTFVVLPDSRGLPYNQRGCFSSGFLSAVHQGTVIDTQGASSFPDLFAAKRFEFATPSADTDGLAILDRLNRNHAQHHLGDSRLEAHRWL